jgi:hypothetical protein
MKRCAGPDPSKASIGLGGYVVFGRSPRFGVSVDFIPRPIPDLLERPKQQAEALRKVLESHGVKVEGVMPTDNGTSALMLYIGPRLPPELAKASPK